MSQDVIAKSAGFGGSSDELKNGSTTMTRIEELEQQLAQCMRSHRVSEEGYTELRKNYDRLHRMYIELRNKQHASHCGIHDQDVCTCRLSDPT